MAGAGCRNDRGAQRSTSPPPHASCRRLTNPPLRGSLLVKGKKVSGATSKGQQSATQTTARMMRRIPVYFFVCLCRKTAFSLPNDTDPLCPLLCFQLRCGCHQLLACACCFFNAPSSTCAEETRERDKDGKENNVIQQMCIATVTLTHLFPGPST